jgi:dihydroorotate dehydrogenase (fumarate)
MTTSGLLRNGPEHVAQLENELVGWMAEHDYDDVTELRGAMSRDATADPAAFERANYIGTLATYTSRFLGHSARQ